ncbi:MAG: CHAT domain-containing tetratricopeptide repeat protein [Desulfobacterales bacterium]|jgi:CHAT domain-containing protein
MAKKFTLVAAFSHRSEFCSFLGSIFIFLAIIPFLFSACTGKMSVEEARQITISVDDKLLTAPPRRIDDILSALNQSDPEDPAITANFRAAIEKPPPQTDNPGELKLFYQNRGNAFVQLGNYGPALADLRLALGYSSRTRTIDHKLLRDLAYAEFVSGNFKKAIEYFEQALSLKEWPSTYKGLVKLYTRVGDLDSAERVADRGISFCNALQNRRGWGNWPVIHAADMKAYVVEAQARFAEAETYYRQILQNYTPSMRKQYGLAYAVAKIYLARNLKNQDRLVEAEMECRDYLKALGALSRNSDIFGHGISELGEIFLRQGRLQDAAKLMRTSVGRLEETQAAADSYLMVDARMRLGDVLVAEQKFDEAMQQFDHAKIDMQQNRYVYENFFARNPALMLSLVRTGRIEEATQQISEVYTKNLELLGENHYLTAEALGLRAMAHARQDNDREALKDFAQAVPVLLVQGGGGSLAYDRQMRLRIILESYLDLLMRVSRSELEKELNIDAASEAFKLADALSRSAVRGAIGASTARAAVTSDALAGLVRQEQDAQKYLKLLEIALSDNLAAPPEQQLTEVITALKAKINTLSRARWTLVEEINTRFPKYAELTHPKPVGIRQLQNHLRSGEAIVSIYTSDANTYVWAIPCEGRFSFCALPIGRTELSQMVVDLRKALDPKPKVLGDIPEFDTSLAYELYRKLFEPVKKGWQDASNLLIVAQGPLDQLPFAVLPTAAVSLGEERVLFDRYQKVPWLIRKISVTRLPSASNLVSLRSLAEGDSDRKPFAGFGDPVFNPQQLAQTGIRKGKEKLAIEDAGPEGQIHVRGIRVSNEGLLDSDKITSCTINDLKRLPDTSAEIAHIAEALGADSTNDVFLGKQASEHRVKSMDLSDRRVIAFATHALVPGDLDGLDQPALALCSPSVSGDGEDGLLTMEEILRLKLNADWVVLSACNTGAAEGKGAEAISGLGQAFFYAGTRAILVSMWPVETTSARKLTTGLFRYQQEDPTLSRSRALQKSALALIDGPGLEDQASGKIAASYAHPLFWAPFIIVGESGIHTP